MDFVDNNQRFNLEFFLQAVHLGPQSVNDVLPVFQHEALQLLGVLHLLDLLQTHTKPHQLQ